MTKNEYIIQYGIKDALPIDPSKKALPAEGFAMALEDFLSERFRGAVTVDREVVSAREILISAEYVAYFFKILLTDVYARQLLRINIGSDESSLIIDITTDVPLCLSDREMREIIRLARNGGFEIYPEECRIRLTAGLSPAMIRRVYAVSVVDSRRVMLSKLGEIFFCGELLYDTDDVDVLTIAWKKQHEKKNRTNTGRKNFKKS